MFLPCSSRLILFVGSVRQDVLYFNLWDEDIHDSAHHKIMGKGFGITEQRDNNLGQVRAVSPL